MFKSLLDIDISDLFGWVDNIKEKLNSPEFNRYAESAASHMVTGLYVDNAKTWKQAAQQSMMGQNIYNMLRNELHGPVGFAVQNLVKENAQLITSFPLTVAEEVNDYITREAMKGRRHEAIAEELMTKFPKITENRINLIARTETSKASTALTQARSVDLGIYWYIWRTSKDARVRSSHQHMDRVLVNFNDPPSPEALIGVRSTLGHYHAGNCPNCRCYVEPIVKLELIRFPCEVYYQGQLAMMTLNKFKMLQGYKEAA